MKGVGAEEFIDSLLDGPACVRHKGYVYRFLLSFHPGRNMYRVSVEKYRWTKAAFEDFMDVVYSYEAPDEEDCLHHLTEDILWDGRSFYELEKSLSWVDW